jgi:exosortase/archaeosortase family protein
MARKRRPKHSGIRFAGDQQRLWETLLFLVKVIALSVPLYLIIIFSISLAPLQALDASVSSAILRAMGYTVQQDGAHLSMHAQKALSFYLSEDCTVWKSALFLFALIFAVPAVGMGKRLAGLAAGIPILWLGNQARIIGVVMTQQATNVQFAMFTHDYFWRVFLVGLVLGMWLAWMRPPEIHRRVYARGTGILSSLWPKSFPRLISRKTKR